MIEELRRAVRIQRQTGQEVECSKSSKDAHEPTARVYNDIVFHHLCVGERLHEYTQSSSELAVDKESIGTATSTGTAAARVGVAPHPSSSSSPSSSSASSSLVNARKSGDGWRDAASRHVTSLAREQHLLALELHDLTCGTCRRCAETCVSSRASHTAVSRNGSGLGGHGSLNEDESTAQSNTPLFEILRREHKKASPLATLHQSLQLTFTCARSSASNVNTRDLIEKGQKRSTANPNSHGNERSEKPELKRCNLSTSSGLNDGGKPSGLDAQKTAQRWMAACAAVSPIHRILFAQRSSNETPALQHSKKESKIPTTTTTTVPATTTGTSIGNSCNEVPANLATGSSPKADGPSFKIRIGSVSGAKRARSPNMEAEPRTAINQTSSSRPHNIQQPVELSRTNSCVDVDDDSSTEENAVDFSISSLGASNESALASGSMNVSSSGATNEFSGSPWSIARQKSGNLKSVSFSAPRGRAAQPQLDSTGITTIVNDEEVLPNAFTSRTRDGSDPTLNWSASRGGSDSALNRRHPQHQQQQQQQQHQSTLSDFFGNGSSMQGKTSNDTQRRIAPEAPPEFSAASRLARAMSNQNVEEMFGSAEPSKTAVVPQRQTSDSNPNPVLSKPATPSVSEASSVTQKTDPNAANRSFIERLTAQQGDARRYFTEKAQGSVPSTIPPPPAPPSTLSSVPRSNIHYAGADTEPQHTTPSALQPSRGFVSAGEQLQDDIKAGKLPTSFFARSGPPPSMGLRRTGFNPPFANNPNANAAPAPTPPNAPARSGNSSGNPGKQQQRGGRDNDDDEGEGKYPESLLLPDGSVPPILIPLDPKLVTQVALEIMESNTPNVGWEDIAGLEHAKSSVEEAIVWPLRRPDLFVGLRDPPRGLLLFGPPGTGKTMIARAIASRANCTFLNISSSSLMSKWLGDGEKLVRCLFAVATVKQPSVIFIDELDSLLSMRGEGEMDSVRRVKTEFLVQLDGVATDRNDRVLLIGATNRPDELDEAARRRLEKRLYIPLPDVRARRDIIQRLLSQLQEKTDEVRGRQLSSGNLERDEQGGDACHEANLRVSRNTVHSLDETQIYRVGELTEGYSGADLKHVCREAAMGPLREVTRHLRDVEVNDLRPITMKDFAHALRRIKPSVGQDEVKRYVTWNDQFGSFPVDDDDVDGRESSLNSGDDNTRY